MNLLCQRISTENCHYVGEGNVGLVVRLSIPEKEDIVIRLVKDEVSVPASSKMSPTSNLLEDLEDHIAMIKNVMKPLLGSDVVYCPGIILLCAEQVKAINNIVNIHRPAFRCNKVVKEVDMHVLVFPDFCNLPESRLKQYTVGPVLSVEIKPKQGVIEYQKSVHVPKLCNFCMMQYYKLQKGSISKRSGYCPMNLFSGCPEKMKHAIRELFRTPQNNFRIFKDQDLVYSDEKKCDLNMIFHDFFGSGCQEMYISKLSTLIMKVLLKPLNDNVHKVDFPQNLTDLQCSNYFPECSHIGSGYHHKLPENCILQRVMKLQSFDNIDIDTLHMFYKNIEELNLTYNFSQYNRTIGIQPVSQIPHYLGQQIEVPSESKLHYMSRKVWEFLLALIVKDCSLMLTFKCLENDVDLYISGTDFCEENIIVDDVGNRYLFSLAVIDLNFKHLSKVEKVYRNRKRVEEAYLDALKYKNI